MKYIRTKDGIYEVVGEERYYFLISPKNIKEDCYDVPSISKGDVVKQADTIAELCDEHIVINDTFYKLPHLSVWLPKDEEKLKYIVGDSYKIYGAIWVIDENGVPTLKPVAKMVRLKGYELL